jgi:hypothetical protein
MTLGVPIFLCFSNKKQSDCKPLHTEMHFTDVHQYNDKRLSVHCSLVGKICQTIAKNFVTIGLYNDTEKSSIAK